MESLKLLVCTCLVTGHDKMTVDLDGFHGPLGESGDWRIICRKKRKWFFRSAFLQRNLNP